MIQPTNTTDAAPPERGCMGFVFLAGAIKHWWLSRCQRCSHLWEPLSDERCPTCSASSWWRRELWGSPVHEEYVSWRNAVRTRLVTEGYLTYAPHEAFKGTWAERAQVVNDAGIAASDVMLVLSPRAVTQEGTDDEIRYAERVHTPVLWTPPDTALDTVVRMIEAVL